MKEPKKKFKKDGSLTIAAKKYLSLNIDSIDKNSLSKEEKKYINRVESGRRLAEQNKTRERSETGRFLTKQETENRTRLAKALGKEKFKDLSEKEKEKVKEISSGPQPVFESILKTLKSTEKDTDFTASELLTTPDLYSRIDEFSKNKTLTAWMNIDRLNSEVQKYEFITIRDQNGNTKEVTREQAILLIRSTNKKIMQSFEGGKFTAETKVKQSATGLEIFLPNLDDLSREEIEEELSGLDDFIAYGS